MYGNIYYIERSWGVINGDDDKEYFFHKTALSNCTIYQLSEGDRVEFQVVAEPEQTRDRAVQVRKKDSVKNVEAVKVKPGINPSFQFANYNEDEKQIIQSLGKVFYVTNGGNEIKLAQSTYRYCIVKPTEVFSLNFNLKREIIVVFSDYVVLEPRSLDAAPSIMQKIKSKLRIDRGCQILISSDVDIENNLNSVLKDTNLNSIVIPFSYKELLKQHDDEFIVKRFRKYLFDVDLFSTSKPVENDLFFFGRRDYAFDIANKCKNCTHSGVFGLRRSGKTSLLFAVKRLLETDHYPTVFIPCQSQLANTNWKTALYEIIKNIIENTNVVYNPHTKSDYIEENAAVCFEEDLNFINGKVHKPIILLFDEIESITFNVSNNEKGWRNGEDFVHFWNAIKGYYSKYPTKLSIVVAGTNPMINEVPVIDNDTPNPMFGQLSKANQGAYLLPFEIVDTHNMVNTIGNYMGMSFDEPVCATMTLDCGGHPYLIRLLCSYINSYIKTEKIQRPKKITMTLYKDTLKKFEETNDATGFYLMILNILVSNYPKEFNALKEIAINGDKYLSEFVDDNSLSHLLGYGLIESSDNHFRIRFATIERYLLGKYKFERRNLTVEEQKEEIQYRLNIAEIELRKLVKMTLLVNFGEKQAISVVLQSMNTHRAISKDDLTNAQKLTLTQLFDPSINKMYFSLLSQIVIDNFSLFSNIFDGVSDKKVQQYFGYINKARRAPDHSYTELSEGWTENDFLHFREAISWLEQILKK